VWPVVVLECAHSPFVFARDNAFAALLARWRDPDAREANKRRAGIASGLILAALQRRNQQPLTIPCYLQIARCVLAAARLYALHPPPSGAHSLGFSSLFHAAEPALPLEISRTLTQWFVQLKQSRRGDAMSCAPSDAFDCWMTSVAAEILLDTRPGLLRVTCEHHFAAHNHCQHPRHHKSQCRELDSESCPAGRTHAAS